MGAVRVADSALGLNSSFARSALGWSFGGAGIRVVDVQHRRFASTAAIGEMCHMTTRDISEPDPPPSSTSDSDEPHPQPGAPATNVFGQPGGNLEEGDRSDEGTTQPKDAD